ncbi:MAG: SprT family zinc-dependent metalloprotease [Chloroflexota bacterium]
MHIDQIIRSKRKTISIEIRPHGHLLVRAPQYASDVQIFAALEQRADWIQKTHRKLQKTYRAQSPKRFREGEKFWYLGQQYPLSISDKTAPALSFHEDKGLILSRHRLSDAKALFIALYRKRTRQLVTELTKRYSARYGFQVNKLRITSAKTRWGSCSTKNNLNFTYRLCMAPLSAVEYIVVHELVHTKVKNHSRVFWNAVNDIYPAYKAERAWLKKNGYQLTLD